MNENNEKFENNAELPHTRRKSAIREPHQASHDTGVIPEAPPQERAQEPTSDRRPRPANASAGASEAANGQRPRPANANTGTASGQRPRPANVNSGAANGQRPRPANVNSGTANGQRPRPANTGTASDRRPRPANAGSANGQRPRPANVSAGAANASRAAADDVPPQTDALRTRKKRKLRARTVIFRTLLVIFTIIFVLIFSLIALCRTLVTGPSETVRDLLVLSAMQASATKWIPGLFLDDALVEEICSKSEDVQEQVIPLGDLIVGGETTVPGGTPSTGGTPQTGPVTNEPVSDEWANAIDGMIYKTYSAATFKAYILIIKDPSRVYVGTSSNFKEGKIGARIFDIVEREGAVAAINGGEFEDTGGQGTGDNPMGLTYSKGQCVWDDKAKRTFIGFDKNNVLHAVESITRAEADELGIRDAVSFQTGNVLISNDGVSVSLHYRSDNVGVAQRTAIGQRADGAVIFVVTDGRTASSLGATHDNIIDLLLSEGAVVAGMLDGGSSAMMYYRDYFVKYNIDTGTLDEYQRLGLVNRYKAFTKPRHLPTYFLVGPEA